MGDQDAPEYAGGSADVSITVLHNANYDLFSNIQDDAYWSATEYALAESNAWIFGMNGMQHPFNDKDVLRFAWAVHSGDVSAIPVPAAVWLFGSGLIGLVGLARRKKA